MVRRVPGFTLVEGDDEVRGLVGSAPNVLIDGRLVPATEDIEDVLSRITPDRVARLELIDAGSTRLDLAGHPRAVNVILLAASSLTGVAEAELGVDAEGRPSAVFDLSGALTHQGGVSEASLRLYDEIDDDSGPGLSQWEFLDGSPSRGLSLAREERSAGLELRGRREQPVGGGSAQLRGELWRASTTEEATEIPLDAGDAELGSETEAASGLLAALQYERPLGRRTFDILLSHRAEWTEIGAQSVQGAEVETFSEDRASSETIFRAGLRGPWGGRAYGLVGELAYNRLSSDSALLENGVPAAAFDPVEVSELRTDITASLQFRPAPRWSLETQLRFEASRLTQEGSAAIERRFAFLKPRLLATWTGEGREIRFRLEREVSQLNFEDFVASASLVDDLVTAGAQDLSPETRWTFEVRYQQALAENGSFVLAVGHQQIDNTIDYVPVLLATEMRDAPGNLGPGSRSYAQIAVEMPLEWIGLPGVALDADITFASTAVTDPLTGETRPISGEPDVVGEIGFEQQFSDTAWGIELSLAEREWDYRFDEARSDREPASLSIYVERELSDAWRLSVEASGLLRDGDRTIRRRYSGDRSQDGPASIERREFDRNPRLAVTLRRSLG